MAYSDDYVGLYTAIMDASMAASSPYDKTVAKIVEFYDQRDMTEEMKAKLFTQYMANITTGITTQAMQVALQAVDRASLLPHQTTKAAAEAEIADDTSRKSAVKQKPVKENIILDKQALKLDEEITYVDAQEQALIAQVDDNRKIKVLQSYADVFLGLAAGGQVLDAGAWATLRGIAEAAAKGIDISTSIGEASLKQPQGEVYFCNNWISSVAHFSTDGYINLRDRLLSALHIRNGVRPTEGDYWRVILIRYRTGTEGSYVYHAPDINQPIYDPVLDQNTLSPHLSASGNPIVSGTEITGGQWVTDVDIPDSVVDTTDVGGASGWNNGDAIYWDGNKFARLSRAWI